MIYVAVSIANSCSYCVHSHTAQAKAKGMGAAEHAELLVALESPHLVIWCGLHDQAVTK